MPEVLLTKRIEFAAAHRYVRGDWDEARNRAVFGPCYNAPGHGHNYMLEVTISGAVDPLTGMVVNLYDLKQILKDLLGEFDHKHLNLDTAYFRDRIPTTENIAAVLWGLLMARITVGRLKKLRLFEDEDLCAEVTGEPGQARLIRRYHFSAAHRLDPAGRSAETGRRGLDPCGDAGVHGHNYVLYVTLEGRIDPETGMVVDLPALDRAVGESVLRRFDRRDLNRDPDLAGLIPTGETLVRLIRSILVKACPGRVLKLGLAETRETYFECDA